MDTHMKHPKLLLFLTQKRNVIETLKDRHMINTIKEKKKKHAILDNNECWEKVIITLNWLK